MCFALASGVPSEDPSEGLPVHAPPLLLLLLLLLLLVLVPAPDEDALLLPIPEELALLLPELVPPPEPLPHAPKIGANARTTSTLHPWAPTIDMTPSSLWSRVRARAPHVKTSLDTSTRRPVLSSAAP